MRSTSDKIVKKELIESLVNRDSSKFIKIFKEEIINEHSNLVNERFQSQVRSLI